MQQLVVTVRALLVSRWLVLCFQPHPFGLGGGSAQLNGGDTRCCPCALTVAVHLLYERGYRTFSPSWVDAAICFTAFQSQKGFYCCTSHFFPRLIDGRRALQNVRRHSWRCACIYMYVNHLGVTFHASDRSNPCIMLLIVHDLVISGQTDPWRKLHDMGLQHTLCVSHPAM